VQSSDQLRIDTPEQIALELPLAGIGSRFIALALDTLLQTVGYVLIFLVLVFTFPSGGLGEYLRWIPARFLPAIFILLSFCIYWGYFAVFEVIWKGQTPGKRAAKIRVIKESGRPINAYEAIGRNLLRAIDWLPAMYAVGIVCMMLNNKNRRLGDFVAGTVVVHDKPAEEIPSVWSAPANVSASNPITGTVTAEELVLIETYLQRRYDLDLIVRDRTAYEIATRITARTGIQRAPEQSLDDFLESIAKRVRDTAGFH